MSLLRYVRPMGIYETLYAFMEAFGTYMGEAGTHPWSQGFPRTVQRSRSSAWSCGRATVASTTGVSYPLA